MERFKVLVYDNPNSINIPQNINKILDDEKNNQTTEYYIFMQKDIMDKAINSDELCSAYCNFCEKMDLPFAMYQYYNNFNRILPGSLNKVNPRLIIHTDKYGIFDIVTQLAYGFFIINVKKFIDSGFKFNETYTKLFYLQDMLEYFYQHKLYISNFCLFELHDSELLFKEPKDGKTGYYINMEEFNKEREAYFKTIQPQYKNINEIIEQIKERYGTNTDVSGISTFNMLSSSNDLNNTVGLVDIQKLINGNN